MLEYTESNEDDMKYDCKGSIEMAKGSISCGQIRKAIKSRLQLYATCSVYIVFVAPALSNCLKIVFLSFTICAMLKDHLYLTSSIYCPQI